MAGEHNRSDWETRAVQPRLSLRPFTLLVLSALFAGLPAASAAPITPSSYPGGTKPSAYGLAPPPYHDAAPPQPQPEVRTVHSAVQPAQRPIQHSEPPHLQPQHNPAQQPGTRPAVPASRPEGETAQALPHPRPGYYPPLAARIGYGMGPGGTNSREQARDQGRGEHLPMWLRQHQNESPAEQENALRREPGFNRLSPQQQQERINTLRRLDQMPPEQRERTLMRMENFERLSPQMKEAVRSSTQQLSYMPPDRKRLWQKAFRDLREMPPEQRQAVMQSPQFAGQFSAQERSIMSNLLAVEPYSRPAPPPMQPQYGK